MNKLGFCETQRWEEQTLADAVAWHEATGSLTATNAQAYKAGYKEGYRAALSALKLHGFIEMDSNR